MALQPITEGAWRLVVEATGEPVHRYAEVIDFRGDRDVIVTGTPPHRAGVSGYVETESEGLFYPSAFGLKWVKGA